VNVAARLEQVNKELGTRVLVSRSTMDLLRDDHGLTALGAVHMQGKQREVQVYGNCVAAEPARSAGPSTPA